VTVWSVAMRAGAKKGTQLCLTEESYINKESEKQLRSRYDHLFVPNILLSAGLSAKFTAGCYRAMD